MFIRHLLGFSVLLYLASNVNAGSRADSHAPIGVMGDHAHNAGEWMWSYRYMTMSMDTLRDGSDEISPADVHDQGFMVTPTSMDMNMHMLGVMYAPSDSFTLMAMVPMIDNKMNNQMRMMGMGGMAMTTAFDVETSGMGDIKVGTLYTLASDTHSDWLINAMVSLPTGSIDEEGVMPMSSPNEVQLPYPMQLGSGTFDLLPGVTYTAMYDSFSWGAQAKAVLRTGENDRGYRLGNQFELQAWYAMPFATHWSWSLRADYKSWENIEGEDEDLNPMMLPTARTDLREGSRLDIGFGLNFILPGDATNRLAIEFLTPLAEDLTGPQLGTDSQIVIGWQLSY